MGRINYRAIYEKNKHDWYAMTEEPQKYEALLAGHYSDSNHFVYELLQNAEDENADRVVIEYDKNQLIFYHNGEPFDEADVKGVSSMLMGTKSKNDAQTIGRFGMGFKSVFKYTNQPEVYSNKEAFLIRNYLLPEEIKEDWNFEEVKKSLSYPDSKNRKYYPFRDTPHLTKIVIPFQKMDLDGRLYDVSGQEVLEKLQSLTGELLLFLTDIKDLYWINRISNEYAHITLRVTENDPCHVICHMSSTQKIAETTEYIKYKRRFDLDEMQGAEVSVAFRLGSNGKVIAAVDNAPVWVYFPTREDTDLPFLIHGSFETAVSREKLMTVSSFNKKLFDRLGDLIADSMEDLAARKLLSQGFIREILLPAFRDESINGTLVGLKSKITSKFRRLALLPCRNGEYGYTYDVYAAIPFGIAEMASNPLLKEQFREEKKFVALNNERAKNFTEYINWLINDLDVKTFDLVKLAKKMENISLDTGISEVDERTALEDIYRFLTDYRESLYERTGLRAYFRTGLYESMIGESVRNVWDLLKKAPIILNAENTLVSAYRGSEPNVYLSASSIYRTVAASAIVDSKIAKEFEKLLRDGFKIPPFDNLQYVKEKIIKKYISGETIHFEKQDYEEEYVEDIQQLLMVFEGKYNTSDLIPLIAKASILKIETDDPGLVSLMKPSQVYAVQSKEGINLKTYFSMPSSDDESRSGVYPIDEQFYESHGIETKVFTDLGMITTAVDEGTRYYPGGPGDESWTALGDFCPYIRIRFFEDNLEFIQDNAGSSISRAKSAELLNLLLCINQKLSGEVKRRKTNPYFTKDEARQYSRAKRYYAWLYNKEGILCKITQMSKFDLDPDLYGELHPDKSAYERLGFIETEDDSAADAFDQVDKLDEKNRRVLLRQLAKSFGMKVVNQDENTGETAEPDDGGEEVFNPDEYVSTEFPVSRIKNIESLIEHVQQQFFCADPVKYQKVLRQIRTSKSVKAVRAYAKGMYTNDNDLTVCQSCKKPSPLIDVTEIANYGIELPQLHLCLCKDCSAKYKTIRDSHKDTFRDSIQKALLAIDIESEADAYEVDLTDGLSLRFTQTHLAEIQTIFGLLAEYGIPGPEEEQEDQSGRETGQYIEGNEHFIQVDERADINFASKEDAGNIQLREKKNTEEKEQFHDKEQIGSGENELSKPARFDFDSIPVSEPIKDGDLVSYKKLNTLEIVDAVIDSMRYPLHKSFIGKQVGDLVVANGRRYLIVSII